MHAFRWQIWHGLGPACPAAPPAGITHLSLVNHHISTILDIAAGRRAGASGWHLPRQASAAAGAAPGTGVLTGVSSFAFQGTNAHALLQQAPSAGAPAAAAPAALAAWSRQRAWVAPLTHILLQRAVVGQAVGAAAPRRQGLASFEASLAVPQLALLREHRVLGLVLFPATGFVEASLAAQRVLANSNDLAGSALCGAVFATPLTLGPAAAGPGLAASPVRLVCSVSPQSGTVELSSAHGGQLRSHFYALVSAAGPAAASVPGSSAPSPAAGPSISSLLAVLVSSQAVPAAARLAAAAVEAPTADLGFALHPAVSEAAQHISVAHNPDPEAAPALRVAARADAVYVPTPAAAEPALWAFSLASLDGRRSRKWLVGGAAAAAAGAFEGVESRRLVAHRPAVMTPR